MLSFCSCFIAYRKFMLFLKNECKVNNFLSITQIKS